MKRYTIEELQNMRESEDHVEFKRGDKGNISYNGAHKDTPKERRRCILGFEVLALCQVRDGEHKNIDKEIAIKLEHKNCIEKHGKTNAQFYTLPRRYYEMTGKEADYSTLVDWNVEQFLAVLSPYLAKYGKARKSDIVKIVGDHITEKQLRSYLSQLRKEGIIKTEGSKRYTSYMLDENYILNNELRNRAISIGMKTMKENGEI